MQLVPFDDFQLPGTRLGDGGRCLRSLITGIGEDALDEGEQAAGGGAAPASDHLPIAPLIRAD